MNRGAAGWEYPRPGYRRYDKQTNSASVWSHHVRRLPSQSERHMATGGAGYSPAPKPRSVTCEQDLDSFTKSGGFIELKKNV